MKNPWLSMWLSGANAWSGAARGMMAAEMRKNQNAMMREATKQATDFWFAQAKAVSPTTPVKRKRRTTRR